MTQFYIVPAAPGRRWLPLAQSLCLWLVLCCMVTGCNGSQEKDEKVGAKKRSAVPVAVAVSGKKTLPVELTAVGHVEASATAAIRSQVTGVLDSVHFNQGDTVKAGTLLFTIDPRPFAAALAKAEAALAKDRADLANAQREALRYTQAVKKGLVAEEQADQATTKQATLAATVKADEAAVDQARLDLAHCTIRAPFTGRTGELLSDPGNLIRANDDTPMLTLRQVDPLLVVFPTPGAALQDIVRYQAAGSLQVLISPTKDTALPIPGRLVFIDNTVDPTTGIIRLKARCSDAGQRLWPGLLVDVRLILSQRPDCIVVPAQAVQTGQNGAYLYVVQTDNIVRYRPVTAGMAVAGERVIDQGLAAGERVVIDGQMQLADGVSVQERPAVPVPAAQGATPPQPASQAKP